MSDTQTDRQTDAGSDNTWNLKLDLGKNYCHIYLGQMNELDTLKEHKNGFAFHIIA